MRLRLVLKIFFISSLIISCTEEKLILQYDYLTYLPPGYQEEDAKKWPLIIFLHGASLRGNNLEKIKKYGIPKLISDGKEFDFIIISPQCPLYRDWSTDIWFPSTFVDMQKKFRIDTNRVYLTGLSMGGEGTWYISEQFPQIFAAIAPVCGRMSEIPSIKKNVKNIANLPIWIFHGTRDRVYPVEESDNMSKLLKRINPNVKYTRYPDLGHGATHDTTYKNHELYTWFLSHSKK